MARKADERPLPHSLEAEVALLGALLVNPALLTMLPSSFQARDFYRDAHRRIYAAMVRLHDARTAIDFVTLREELTRTGELDGIGGPAYLAGLADGVPRSSSAVAYAGIVQGHAVRRQTIAVANKMLASAYEAELPPGDLLDHAQRDVLALAADASGGSPVRAATLLAATMEAIEATHGGHTLVIGVPSGFDDLDHLTGGLQRGDLILLAARPSVGKTSLALQVAWRAAFSGRHVTVFSLEMTKQALMMRLVCGVGRVSSYKLRSGYTNEKEYARIAQTVEDITGAQLYIDDTPGLFVTDLRARARRARVEHGLDLLVVDYLQLLRARGRFDGRQQEVTEISRVLKETARELDVPLLALSQLTRPPKGTKEHRPRLEDLRESGSLEQDADVVILLSPGREGSEDEDTVDVHVAKQRNGPTGHTSLVFLKDLTWFEPLATGQANG